VGVGGQSWGAKAGFVATTVVNRKDYGINWNKTLDNGGLMLSDEVTISLSLEANQVPPAAK
jgi:polyisoprenoid-binding protein YceI